MQKIVPSLWFDDNAEEAMNFYVSIFPNSLIIEIHRYPEGIKTGPMKGFGGKVLTGIFELDGQRFLALDGGPLFKFTEAISFHVECETQKEIDHYWSHLSAVPESEQCGWLKDKYGISWQIVPKVLSQLLTDPDPMKAERAMQAMLKMKKFDIEELKKAANKES